MRCLLPVLCSLSLIAQEVTIEDPRSELLATDYRLYCQAIGLDLETVPPWYGAEIVAVDDDGPAALAGLEVGDILLSWAGLPYQDLTDVEALREIALRQGRRLAIAWRRFGEDHDGHLPCTRPGGRPGFTLQFETGPVADVQAPLLQLFAQAGVTVEEADRPFLHRVPDHLVESLRDWLRDERRPQAWMQRFAAWYPLVLDQRWSAAAQRWLEEPPLHEQLPAPWRIWLQHLDAVCRGDTAAVDAHGYWYRLRHHPHPLHLPPLGEALFASQALNQAVADSRRMAGGDPTHLAMRVRSPSPDAGPARRFMRRVARALVFADEAGNLLADPALADGQLADTSRTLTALADDPRIDAELHQAAIAFTALRDDQPGPMLQLIKRWQRRSPWSAYLLARRAMTVVEAAEQRSSALPIVRRAEALRLFTPHADDGFTRLVADLTPLGTPRLQALLGPDDPALLIQLWRGLHERRDALLSVERELLAGKTDLNNMAWDYCVRPGFEVDGLAELYRRELVRAAVDAVPAYLADTVAALDMLADDPTAALIWQRAAVDMASPHQRQEYLDHLQHFLAEETLPRTGPRFQMTDIEGGRAGRLDGAWHGPLRCQEDPWLVEGWMARNRATGPWSISRDGQRVITGHYHEDRPVGPWQVYDENGYAVATGLYNRPEGSAQARRIGWWRFREVSSMRVFIGPFLDGRPTGRWWFREPDGSRSEPRPWREITADETMRSWVERVTTPMPSLPPPHPDGQLFKRPSP